MTALVAGHETTASQLAWAFERLAREPAVVERLREELDGDSEEYLTATVNEVLRHRPVLPNVEPRLVKRPVTIGGVELPARSVVGRQRLPRPPRPRDLPRPVRVLPGALPRARGRSGAGHVHVDPIRGRPAPLPGRKLCHAGDAAGAARSGGALASCTPPAGAPRPPAGGASRSAPRAAAKWSCASARASRHPLRSPPHPWQRRSLPNQLRASEPRPRAVRGGRTRA